MKIGYHHAISQELLEDLVVAPTITMHREVERGLYILSVELNKDSVVAELKGEIEHLREELTATDAEVKKIVAKREAALDEVERLQEIIRWEAKKHNIFNKPQCHCPLCETAREGR